MDYILIFHSTFVFSLQKYAFPSLIFLTEATDLLQKLSLDPQTKALEIPEPTKKVTCCLIFDWLVKCILYSIGLCRLD